MSRWTEGEEEAFQELTVNSDLRRVRNGKSQASWGRGRRGPPIAEV